MSHARAIWSTNSMLRISIFQIEEWPWCRRPAVWVKPNTYIVTHASQNGKRLQTFFHVSPCSLPHSCVLYVLPSQNKTDSFNPKILVWMAIEECTCSCPTNILLILLREGWGRFAFTGAMVGEGVVGRVAGVFRPRGIQNFGNSKFLQVVLILHAIQMMRTWNLHSKQKQDMQFRTWSKNNAESKDTFHKISNRVKNKMLNKYH